MPEDITVSGRTAQSTFVVLDTVRSLYGLPFCESIKSWRGLQVVSNEHSSCHKTTLPACAG